VFADMGRGNTAISNKGRQISALFFFCIFSSEKVGQFYSISAYWWWHIASGDIFLLQGTTGGST
jgi:hypothetical protein